MAHVIFGFIQQYTLLQFIFHYLVMSKSFCSVGNLKTTFSYCGYAFKFNMHFKDALFRQSDRKQIENHRTATLNMSRLPWQAHPLCANINSQT